MKWIDAVNNAIIRMEIMVAVKLITSSFVFLTRIPLLYLM